MELQDYFEPIAFSVLEMGETPNTYGKIFHLFATDTTFPDLEEIDMVIFGVPEERGAVDNAGCQEAAHSIRSKLFSLYAGDYKVRVADIGDLKIGDTIEDTYIAVAEVCAELMKQRIIPILIGGSQDISFAQYKSYKALGQMMNIVSIDSHFDLGTSKSELTSKTFLGNIIKDEPNFLFNYSNIGYQSYFVGSESIQLMKKLYFDVYRLGQVRSDMEEMEPIIRNADMLSFDVSSVRQSDAPGIKHTSPNGFYGEEVCQLMRYAGISDKLSSIGIYEVNPKYDDRDQTSFLVAQMIWYFMDGYYHRKQDDPHESLENFLKYMVRVKSMDQELLFYKSKKTDRWWMEMNYTNNSMKYMHKSLVPCSYKDYQSATNDEISERWWQSYHKFN